MQTRIPFLTGFLQHLDDAGKFAQFMIKAASDGMKLLKKTTSGSVIGGIVLDAIDFFRIPFLYLGAWLTGTGLPFTLSNNAQWLYSAVLLRHYRYRVCGSCFCSISGLSLRFVGCGVWITTLAYHFVKRDRYK